MTLEATGLLNQTIKIRHAETSDGDPVRDKYGEISYGSQKSYSGRYQPSTRRVLNPQGDEVVASGVIYLDGGVGVSVHDEITLPGGGIPTIIRVDPAVDGLGDEFYQKVWLA